MGYYVPSRGWFCICCYRLKVMFLMWDFRVIKSLATVTFNWNINFPICKFWFVSSLLSDVYMFVLCIYTEGGITYILCFTLTNISHVYLSLLTYWRDILLVPPTWFLIQCSGYVSWKSYQVLNLVSICCWKVWTLYVRMACSLNDCYSFSWTDSYINFWNLKRNLQNTHKI